MLQKHAMLCGLTYGPMAVVNRTLVSGGLRRLGETGRNEYARTWDALVGVDALHRYLTSSL
jgi:hypothetical protein